MSHPFEPYVQTVVDRFERTHHLGGIGINAQWGVHQALDEDATALTHRQSGLRLASFGTVDLMTLAAACEPVPAVVMPAVVERGDQVEPLRATLTAWVRAIAARLGQVEGFDRQFYWPESDG